MCLQTSTKTKGKDGLDLHTPIRPTSFVTFGPPYDMSEHLDLLVDLDSDSEAAQQPSSRVAARKTLNEEAARRSTEAAKAVKTEKGSGSTPDSTPSPCLSSLLNGIGINTNVAMEFKPCFLFLDLIIFKIIGNNTKDCCVCSRQERSSQER